VADRHRLLVVTGSRVFDCDAIPRSWARHQLVQAFARVRPDLVAHGGAAGWDRYTDELALWLGVPRAVFDLSGPVRVLRDGHAVALPVAQDGARLPHMLLPGGGGRLLKDAARYRYSGPLPRNEALMRWAADRAAEGHDVEVVGAIAPWSSSGGTRRALDHAAAFDLRITVVDVPTSAWPAEDPAIEGQHEA
jgi:hypothetical protein